ncbi:MAG: glycosyltransferase family 2 protein [Acidobacteria bacterium]|nr:glycosyltransferase family 2 protein [Acidobacteriota bacterium]
MDQIIEDRPQAAGPAGLRRPSVSTLIPVWNEAPAIETAVERTHTFLAENFEDFEILIVESGSTDGSYELCDRLAQRWPAVEVIHEGAPQGFGSALRLGFARASRDLVWAVSADLPFPLPSLLEALPLLEENDCVLSYRVEDERGAFRRLQSRVYNGLAKGLLGLTVTTVNSTFKVYRREVIQGLALRSDGWLIDTEIVYRLERSGARWAELPVPLIDRKAGSSTVRWVTPFLIFRDLLKFAWLERNAA